MVNFIYTRLNIDKPSVFISSILIHVFVSEFPYKIFKFLNITQLYNFTLFSEYLFFYFVIKTNSKGKKV